MGVPAGVMVRSLHLFPVKACRGVEVDRLTIGTTGPVGDRRWQVVDDDAQPLTQRQAPGLATIVVEVVDGGLRLSVEGKGTIEVADPGPDTPTVEVKPLVAPTVTAADGGDEVAHWLAEVLGRPARLAAMIDATDIRLPEPIDMWGHALSFVDAAPILVANQASSDWLAARASEPFGIDRFRSNVVVAGPEPEGRPWVEDTWDRFTIGGASLRAVVPWPRCAVPQVDQVTGERHKEPALALKAHRWCESAPTLPEHLRKVPEGSAVFGIACDVEPVGAEIRVGDEVVVSTTREPALAPPTGT